MAEISSGQKVITNLKPMFILMAENNKDNN
jgi:hypothetical protein